MKYWCYEKSSGDIRPSEFLNPGAKHYLENCESEIYKVWKERSSTYADVSLAMTLQNTVKRVFQSRTIGIDDSRSSQYSLFWMFQHRNDTSGKFLDFYRTAFQSNIFDMLLITQTPEFKTKFMFDGSTMTFESINDDYDEFVDILQPQQKLRIFYLVLADIDLHTSSLEKNGKHFLQLHESDFSKGI